MDGILCIYDCAAQKFVARMKIHGAGITDMDISVSSDFAAASIADGKVHLIDLVSKKRVQIWETGSTVATAVRFEPVRVIHHRLILAL